MSAPVSPPALGFVEWFRPDEQARVEQTIAGLQSAGITRLRTHLSWAEFHAPGGQEWYDWLLPKLGSAFELLPCVHYTPPSLSRTGASSGAPKRLQDYADFVDLVLTRYGTHFREIELWNEPNNLLDWDWREDPDWLLFCEMVGAAAFWVQQRGWRAVLAAPSPFDRNWLELMGERGVLGVVSAVGFHAFPGTWDSEESVWHGYADHAAEVRGILDRYNPQAEVWITEAGYSTWRGDEAEQVRRFEEARNAPVDRLYWYGWQDIARDIPVQEGLYFDPRHYHLGATDAVGRPKLLRRLLEKADTAPWLTQPAATAEARRRGIRPVRPKPHLILGGAGFIGANLAETLLSEGEAVTILDNLGRAGVEQNLAWLKSRHGARLDIRPGDVRDGALVGELMADARAVYHFAAQVAVTDSLVDPLHDFAVNALGTVTVLEALRKQAPDIPLVFASTNKVYGSLEDVATEARDRRQTPLDRSLAERGIGEDRPLQFRTPYGCSKGAADQYVLDYAHSYGLRTAVLRMSCIYGPRQFGTEDQGWVAHFLIRALRGEPITLFGDGTQVRDVLHVRDAVAAYRGVIGQIDSLAGQAFNLGGGPRNAVCLLEVLDAIAALTGRDIPLAHAPLRSGDQPWFVADTGALEAATGWAPTIGWQDGLADLHAWAAETFATESIPQPRRATA